MKKFLSVLLAVMMVLSTVSFAAPFAVTGIETVGGSVVFASDSDSSDESATLFADDTWYDKTKGTLLFNMDFDEDNSGNAVAASAYDGISLGSYSAGAGELVSGLGRLNPDVSGNYDIGFRYTTSGTAALGDNNGNKYLSLNSSGSNQFSLYLGNTFTKAGTYVLEYDYKLDSTGTTTPNYINYHTPSNGNDNTYTFNTWMTNSKTFELTGASNAARVIFYGKGNYSANDKLYLDNIKVWYFDESADYDTLVGQKYVTVYSCNDNYENQVIPVPADTSVTMQQVMEMVSAELPGCLGFAETADGDILPLDTVITIDSNKTFYAVWGFDASVSANGNENVSDLTVSGVDTRSGITVAELISKIDVSASTRPLLGISATADGAVLATSTVITSADTLYMIWGAESLANKWTDAEMGTRLFFMDFESNNSGAAITDSDFAGIGNQSLYANALTDSIGAYIKKLGRLNKCIGPEYDNMFKVGFRNAPSSTAVVGDDTNKYAVANISAAMSLITNHHYVGNGVYTFIFDYKKDCGATFGFHSGYSGGTTTTEDVDGTWTRVKYTVNVSSNSYFRFISNKAPANGSFAFDNIALYFNPAGKLNLTVNNADTSKVYSVDAGTYTASQLVDLVKADIPTCVGFSKTEGGEVLSGDKTIDVLVNTTLYAVAGFDVTLKANDNADFSDVTLTGFNSQEGVTVKELISKIENNTDRLVSGLSETADGELLSKDTVIDTAKTLYIIWTVDESTLGTLVFNLDFEKDGIEAPANGSSVSINTLTDIFNSDLVPEGIKLSLERLNATSLVTENGNTYFASSNQTDSRFKFNINEFETGFAWTNGTYTLVVDVKMGASATASFDSMTAVDSFADEVGEWDRVTYRFDGTFSSSVNSSGELYGTKSFGFAAAAGTSVALDNIKLYYKTDATTITVKNGGNNDITDTVVNVSTTTGITVKDIIEEVNKQSTSRTLLGISTEPTGELLALGEVITPKYPIYLYAIWKSKSNNPYVDDNLGHMLFNVDFEKQEVIDANWNGYAELDNTANPGAGDKITNIASYYNPMLEGENARLMVRIDTSVSASNATVGIGSNTDGNHYIEGTSQHQYPKVQFLNNAKLVLDDGIYTMYVDAMSTGSGSITYQYAGDNCKLVEGDKNNDGKWDFTPGAWTTYGLSFEVTDGAVIPNAQINFSHSDMGHTIAFDNVKLYYKPFTATITLDPGEFADFGTHTVENISTTGENTGDDIVYAIQSSLDVCGKEFAGLMDEYGDTVDLSKPLVIPGDVTYTIIWGDDAETKLTTVESNSVRKSVNANTTGLRFAATTTSANTDEASEYGWIVTRKTLLEDAGIGKACFTLNSSVKKSVGKNYASSEDENVRKHYKEEGGSVMITMVIYNLKPDKYHEVFVARPYIKIGDTTYYGKPWERSIYDTAVALKEKGYPECDEAVIAYIDAIIAGEDVTFDN